MVPRVAVFILILFCFGISCNTHTSAPTIADAWQGPKECSTGLFFDDITDRSPDFRMNAFGGEHGWDHADKYAPGIGLADLNGDGQLDLVQVRSERNQPMLRSPIVYQGNGDGSFTEIARPIWQDQDNATFVLLFDSDGDDDLDLLVGVAGNDVVFYRNDGGFQFVVATKLAGFTGVATWAFAAVAGDVDADGDLDVYLGQWRAGLENHGASLAPNLLLVNEQGHFTVSDTDLKCNGSSTLGLALVDLDGDADLDIYVANDFFKDCLYENLGDGNWKEIGEKAGISDAAMHAMGVIIGDLNDDGQLDIIVTDTEELDSSRGNAAFLGVEGALMYENVAPEYRLDGVGTLESDWLVCWGGVIADFDLDGASDIHVVTHGEKKELFCTMKEERIHPAGL